jgi:hypothetical protein
MFGAESHLDNKFQVKMPTMPGLQTSSANPNPFQGIKRAGQAKRAQNFEKFNQQKQNQGGSQGGFNGQKNQNMGGQAGTLAGSMQQNKPEKFS